MYGSFNDVYFVAHLTCSTSASPSPIKRRWCTYVDLFLHICRFKVFISEHRMPLEVGIHLRQPVIIRQLQCPSGEVSWKTMNPAVMMMMRLVGWASYHSGADSQIGIPALKCVSYSFISSLSIMFFCSFAVLQKSAAIERKLLLFRPLSNPRMPPIGSEVSPPPPNQQQSQEQPTGMEGLF